MRNNSFSKYKSAHPNGIVRIDEDSPATIEGLITSKIKVCFGLIMYCGEKISLLHFRTTSTNFESIQQELDWLADDKSNITVHLVQNQLFHLQNPSHILNINKDRQQIEELLQTNQVKEIIRSNTENGTIYITRENKLVDSLTGKLEDFELNCPGEGVPDQFLQGIISDLQAKSRIQANLQFDGKNWIKNSDISHTIYADEINQLKEIFLSTRSNPTLCESIIKHSLDQSKNIQELKNTAGNFNSEPEYQNWLDNQSKLIMHYLNESLLGGISGKITYKLFSLNTKQRQLIEQLGGEIQEQLDRGMHILRIESNLLKANIRQELNIDRVRITKTNPLQFNSQIAPQLTGKIMGWRGEPDYEKPGSFLITFPYKNETNRQNSRDVINQIVDKLQNEKNNQGVGHYL